MATPSTSSSSSSKAHLRLIEDDGTVLDLHAGDLGFVPQGWAGIWEVVEPVRKAYVVTS